MGKRNSLGGAALSIAIACATPVWAQGLDQNSDLPVVLRADEINHDNELGIVVAKGGVEIAQGERILLADTLSYNQNTDTVTASGNIKILEPTGEVIFAEYLELTDQMRDGAIKEIRILMEENARIAANGALRVGGNTTIMSKAIYSPCDICKDNPEKAPLWQVKAERIVHDQTAKTVEYENAWLEMFGVPVAYTPYLTHPDPSVERKSGFLTPSFGNNTGNTGTFIRAPYFWALAEDKDITFDPILTTKTSPILAGEYRQRFDNGELEFSGSGVIADREAGTGAGTYTKEDRLRGHIFGTGRFDIDDTYRWGFDVERASDRTYLSKFNFFRPVDNSLVTNAYIEGFRQRNYLSANVYDYQDLRENPTESSPVIFPLLQYNGLGEADRYGGRWEVEAGFRGLSQSDQTNNVRLSLDAGYSLPMATDMGILTTLSAKVKSDLYIVEHDAGTNSFGQSQENGVTGRVTPQLSAVSRYPFYRSTGSGEQIIEPVAGIFIAPNGGNSSNIHNNDSTVVEEDDTNLFSQDRIAGRDRVEGGTRVAYGVKGSHFFNAEEKIEAFLGQNYRLTTDNDLQTETGIRSEASNIFGWLDFVPHRMVNLNYRFALDDTDFSPLRNELTLDLGSDALRLTSNYTNIERSSASTSSLEEITLQLAGEFDDYWSGRLFGTRNLEDGPDGGSIRTGFSVVYEDECFILDSSYTRSFVHQTDVNATDTLFFKLTFKTLGEVTI